MTRRRTAGGAKIPPAARRRGTEPGPDGRLSSACVDGLVLEISNQLSISKRAAGGLIDLAADLDARLVLTGKALAAGVISLAKVRIIAEATAALDDAHAAAAETLAANQHIQDRALAYKAAGMPGTMDQLRVRAFLDALNGAPAPAPAPAGPTDPDATDPAGNGGPGTGAEVAANIMLTVPLTTLLGLADRPGDAPGWGALNPALARQMTAAAARNPRSTWCITVTDEQGHAIGHGCAKLRRARRKPSQTRRKPDRTSPHASRDGPGLTPSATPGPDGGYGTWHLTNAGRDYTVQLHPIPVTSCDHRYESAGYRPGRLLRHLVEVRDGQCTQPTCARSARRCDFEHAVPYDQGGRTCGCNGGCRCRRDHRVKQSPGWTVTQPQPGYHQWTTPSGRTFTSEPMRYPI